MQVEQHPYLSAEACKLRQRDGVPPWGVHPSEVDSLGDHELNTPFGQALAEARRLRDEIERQ